jgi:NAD(P)H-flavin reductase/truncated hemoglobin YjbI
MNDMYKLYFQGEKYQCRENETVLQVFMRHGVTVPFSCGNGICHICLHRCESGEVPAESQKGLRQTLQEQGYFLICKCVPKGDMNITVSRDADLFNHAVVYKKELLAPDVCRVLLEPATKLYYHAGQFINIRNQDGDTRSYSLASVPQEDYFLEIHVKRVPGGIMSNWIFDKMSENDVLEFQGAAGNSFYVPGERDQPLLLIGTGTGLSPLIGIARDALINGHTGPVQLYHGSRHLHGLYLKNVLNELSERYANFHPVSCISGYETSEGYRNGRANDVALAEHVDLKGWRVYLCGEPGMVETMQQSVQDAGASPLEIHTDPFWSLANTGETNEATSTLDAQAAKRIQCAERRKYPDPDLELWTGLDDGRLLSKILVDFYNRVYDDPLLSPFFDGVTKQRLIEKQYNFMCQVLTGEDVYFGERPRNAHHWMVISDELLDHREELMESSLRRFGVPEHLVRRLRAIEEIYREDIVKDKPWKKVLFGKEVPVEGFDEMIMDDATLCDSCQQEIQAGERVQYHVRLGKVYCKSCRQDVNS